MTFFCWGHFLHEPKPFKFFLFMHILYCLFITQKTNQAAISYQQLPFPIWKIWMNASIRFTLSERWHSLEHCLWEHSEHIFFFFYKSNSATNSLPQFFCSCLHSGKNRDKNSPFSIFSHLDKTHSTFKVAVLFFGSSHMFLLCLLFWFVLPIDLLYHFGNLTTHYLHSYYQEGKRPDKLIHIIIGFGHYYSSNKDVSIS